MSQIMKGFTGILMILLLMVSSASILGAFLQVTQAQNYHSAMIDEIENSYYCLPVLQECFSIAEEVGYELEITLYLDNGTYIFCSNAGVLPENTRNISMAKVNLTYSLELPFFGLAIERELWGYAR